MTVEKKALFELIDPSLPIPLAKRVFVVAEIGINHNGDIQIAKKLIDMAIDAGCDAVKFQKRDINIVYSKEVLDSPRESPWGITHREQKEALEFGKEEYDEIDRYCREKNVKWFASAWDENSQMFLRQYDCQYNKVASAMITHTPMLKLLAEEKKHAFISTGMCGFKEIDEAVEIFEKENCEYTLLHTVSEYPAHEQVLNLKMIPVLRKRYGCPVGYSGHEVSMIPSVVAVMLGAVCIERHITLDRAMYGSDQAASLEVRGLDVMVSYIRNIPILIGNGEKIITDKEGSVAKKLRYWKPYH